MNNKTIKSTFQLADKIIIDFEEKNNPYKYQIEGYCIWPIVRFITHKNLKINLCGYTTKTKFNKFKIIKQFLISLPYEIFKIFKLINIKKNILIVTFYQCLRDKMEDQYINIYFDYFKILTNNSIYWYNGIFGYNLKKYHSPYINGSVVLFGGLYAKFKIRFYQNSVSKLYLDFKNYLIENNKENYFTLNIQAWHNSILFFLSSKFIFSFYLNKIKPKIVLIENGYGQEGFIAAAKNHNIPILELQHGTIHKGHMGYTYGKTTSNYKKQMPVPDKILTFGKYYSEILKEGYWSVQDLPSIGFPRLEYFKKILRENEKDKEQKNSKIRFLISSQWTVIDKMISFIKEVISSFNPNIIINIKPHPLETKSQIEQYSQLGSRIRIIDKKIEFYQALAQADIHCSVYSTTLFESVAFGVPTIILNIPGYESAYTLVEHHCAKFVRSPYELLDMLDQVVKDKPSYFEWKKMTLKNKKYFFEKNPNLKMEKLLKNFLN